MRVDCREVECANDKKQHRSHGCEARVATSLALGGLKRAVNDFDKAVGLRVWVHAKMPSKCRRINRATSFIGSTFGHVTLVNHCSNIGDDMNLFAFDNLAQRLAIQPGAGRSLGGVLLEKGLRSVNCTRFSLSASFGTSTLAGVDESLQLYLGTLMPTCGFRRSLGTGKSLSFPGRASSHVWRLCFGVPCAHRV